MWQKNVLVCVSMLAQWQAGLCLGADDVTPLKPVLTKPGQLLVEETFAADHLSKSWLINKGDWKIDGEVLVGREKAEDMHAAVLTLRHPHRNSIIQFSFKSDGATGFNLSFNHPKGHLFRVAAGEKGLTLTKDADKKDPNSKPKILAKTAGDFPAGQWRTLLVEIEGDKVTVQSSCGAKLEVTEPSLAVDKTGYRFVMRGETLSLDNIKVWSVE